MFVKNRTDLINYLLTENNYKSYAEIGTSNPAVHFDHIICEKKYSIDPGTECEGWGKDKSEQFQYTHKMTSDKFFEQNLEKFDMIFIDGLHTEKQCALDLYNSFVCINEGGSIVLHDTIPDDIKMTGDEVRKFNWQGNCWKPVYRLIQNIDKFDNAFSIHSFYLDYGITVIKIYKEIAVNNLFELQKILLEEQIALDYERDYHQSKMNIEFEPAKLIHDKVSYFSPLYKSKPTILKKVYQALCAQTLDKWEWVCFDDSPTDELKYFFEWLNNDNRVKYYRLNKLSGGVIGESKYRAAMMCTGKYLAELDHDDIIMPEMTRRLLEAGKKYNADFIYCDSAEVYYNLETDEISSCKRYGDGFGMGYGCYYQVDVINPINDKIYKIDSLLSRQVNPKTLRHIVGVPNHIRVWKREFYMKHLAHCRTLPIADDYELIVRTVLNDGICVHLNWTGYLQLLHDTNATDVHRPLIQEYVKAVRTKYDSEIAAYFEKEDSVYGDWCGRYLKEKMNNDIRLYHCVPNFKQIYPNADEPSYSKLIEVT